MAEKKDPPTYPVPYLNTEFMTTPAARTLRILAEYLEPAERLRRARIRDTIVFFGSARALSHEDAAKQLVSVNDEISRAGNLTPELAGARKRAETAVRLSRYYQD